jgi:hypothetical protein
MAFFATIPISKDDADQAHVFSVSPVMIRAITTPISERGSEIRM